MTTQTRKTTKGTLYTGGLSRDDENDTPTPDNGTEAGTANLTPTPDAGRDNDSNLNSEEATFRQRYGNLRAEFTRKTVEKDQEIDSLKRQLERVSTQVAPEAMPKTPEQLAAWMREYPELASAVKALAKAEIDQEVSGVKAQLTNLKVREKELEREKAALKLSKAHPDIDQLRQDPSFHAWAKTKSKLIYNALYNDEEDDPDAAADAISLFKSETGWGKQKRQQKVSNEQASLDASPNTGSAEPLGNPKRIWKESEVQRMSDRDYEKYEDEIADAMTEGRFKYDIRDSQAA